jgi:hypothetical protein
MIFLFRSDVGRRPARFLLRLCCDVASGQSLSFGPAPYAVVPLLLLPPPICTIDLSWCLDLFFYLDSSGSSDIDNIYKLRLGSFFKNYVWLKYRYSQRGPWISGWARFEPL